MKGNTAVRVASRFLGFVVAALLACPVASAPGVIPDAVVFGQSACFCGPHEKLGVHYGAGSTDHGAAARAPATPRTALISANAAMMKQADRKAWSTVARELGHERADIAAVYLGA